MLDFIPVSLEHFGVFLYQITKVFPHHWSHWLFTSINFSDWIKFSLYNFFWRLKFDQIKRLNTFLKRGFLFYTFPYPLCVYQWGKAMCRGRSAKEWNDLLSSSTTNWFCLFDLFNNQCFMLLGNAPFKNRVLMVSRSLINPTPL